MLKRSSRAAEFDLKGRIWPAGRSLPTPGLNLSFLILTAFEFRDYQKFLLYSCSKQQFFKIKKYLFQTAGDVYNLQPHSLRDYNIRALPDRIRDVDQLMFVNTADNRVIPKNDAFGKYYSTPSDNGNSTLLFVILFCLL